MYARCLTDCCHLEEQLIGIFFSDASFLKKKVNYFSCQRTAGFSYQKSREGFLFCASWFDFRPCDICHYPHQLGKEGIYNLQFLMKKRWGRNLEAGMYRDPGGAMLTGLFSIPSSIIRLAVALQGTELSYSEHQWGKCQTDWLTGDNLYWRSSSHRTLVRVNGHRLIRTWLTFLPTSTWKSRIPSSQIAKYEWASRARVLNL